MVEAERSKVSGTQRVLIPSWQCSLDPVTSQGSSPSYHCLGSWFQCINLGPELLGTVLHPGNFWLPLRGIGDKVPVSICGRHVLPSSRNSIGGGLVCAEVTNSCDRIFLRLPASQDVGSDLAVSASSISSDSTGTCVLYVCHSLP